MANENLGMQILYQNALSGSIVNSDLIFRTIERDRDAMIETLRLSSSLDALRSRDRDVMIDIRNEIDRLDVVIVDKISKLVNQLTTSTAEYVKYNSEEHLENLIAVINKFKDELSQLDENVVAASKYVESAIEDLKSTKAQSRIIDVIEHLTTLETHVTQLYIILLTTEGSAHQCKMTY